MQMNLNAKVQDWYPALPGHLILAQRLRIVTKHGTQMQSNHFSEAYIWDLGNV